MLPLQTFAALLSCIVAVKACNPITTANCPPVPALGTSKIYDFAAPNDLWEVTTAPSAIKYSSDGLEMSINKRLDNPSMRTDFYFLFGKVQFELQAAPGQGVISSVFLQSDDLDEIDFEWFGGDQFEVSTNWFSKGNTATYDRGLMAPVTNPLSGFHTYTYEWTAEYLKWSIDGVVVRTLLPDNGQGFPQSPMRVFIGVWAGGDYDNAKGTIEWAGGLTNYDDVPYTMKVKNLVVSDYSSGSEYAYGDQSGSWESVKAVGGAVGERKAEADSEFDTLLGGGLIPNKEILGGASSSSAGFSETSSSSMFASSSTVSSSSSSSSTSSSTSSSSAPASSTSSSSSSAPASSSTSSSSSVPASSSSSSSSASSSSAPASSSASSSSSSASSSSSLASSSASSSSSSAAKSSSSSVSVSSTTSTASSSLTSAIASVSSMVSVASSRSSSASASASASASSSSVANNAVAYGPSLGLVSFIAGVLLL